MRTVRMLWRLLHPSSFWFATAVLLGALSSLSEGVGITLFIPILSQLQVGITSSIFPSYLGHILSSTATSQVGLLVLFILALIFLKNLLLYANRALLAWIDARTGHELRVRIFDGLMRAPISFWDRRDPGKVLDTLASESWRTAQAFQIFSGSLVHGCTVIVFTVLLFLFSWKLTVLVVGGLGLISAGIRLGIRPVKAVGEYAVRVNAELGARMWDAVAGVRSIHAFSLQAEKRRRFTDTSNQVRISFLRLELLSGLVHPAGELLHAALLLGLLLWFLPHMVPGPAVLVYLLLLVRLQPNVSQFQAAWVTLTGLAGSIQDVSELLESAGDRRPESGGMPARPLEDALFFETVTFRYDGESRAALDQVTARIPSGKVTVIAGPSGAGKTTLVHLICRFYDVTTGSIRADGHALPSLDLESWRSRIGLASQDTHLFSATVRENIALGTRGATNDQIVDAAMRANAHDFILQLPEGYDTRVGERGLRLSGGQRQRIALARAFVRDPEILLLDEATNALDHNTEEAVSRALHDINDRRTLIIVAHHMPTIMMADHVIVLDEGRVVQQGRPSDLMCADGVLSNLFRAPGPSPLESEKVCDTY